MESVETSRHTNNRKSRLHLKGKNFKLKNEFTAKNAERERSRVKSLRQAFQCLQSCLPSVPPNTKLSKLDVLILASNYIYHLTKLLSGDEENELTVNTAFDSDLKFLHPIKKWPMRSRLYAIPETNLYSNDVQYSIQSMQSCNENNIFVNNLIQ